MWSALKKRLSSKTYRASFILSFVGVLEVNFSMLQGLLGEYYGLAFVVSALVFMILRELTKDSIEDK